MASVKDIGSRLPGIARLKAVEQGLNGGVMTMPEPDPIADALATKKQLAAIRITDSAIDEATAEAESQRTSRQAQQIRNELELAQLQQIRANGGPQSQQPQENAVLSQIMQMIS